MLRGEKSSSQEMKIQICDCNEDELHSMSCREKEKLSAFRALKENCSRNIPSQSSQSKPLIQRVSATLSENKKLKRYFEPRVVAIGPLHHRDPRVQPAESVKLELAALFTEEHKVNEQVLYRKIKKEIGCLRKCYKEEDIKDYDDEELAWMFFVDGCAVLTAIQYDRDKNIKLNYIIKADLLSFALVDLFMMENQIPFRVLQLLINSVDKGKELRNSIDVFIDDKIKNTIAKGSSTTSKEEAESKEQDEEQPTHLLGFLRQRLLTKQQLRKTSANNTSTSKCSFVGNLLMRLGSKKQQLRKTFRSIKELKEAGIHVSLSETSSLKDVHFHVGFLGTLKIPQIVVDDSTGSKFMNLVAYEMCPDFRNDFEVTSYLCFLDSLIDTAEDVKELRHAGMLLNYMGSDKAVADLFNTMTKDLVPDLRTYEEVNNKIQSYCDNQLTTCVAKVYYTHFSTPWSIVVFVGAFLGLLFTAIQAFYAMRRNGTKK